VHVGFHQLALEIKPADPWQPDIKDEAARDLKTAAAHELRRGPEQLYVQTHGFDEALDRSTNRWVIIDYENDGSWLSHDASLKWT